VKRTEAPKGVKPAPGKTQPSVAVLPFHDMSPDKDQDYFCEGMSEELLNALVKVEGLKVAARTSAFQFKGKDIDIRKIGEQLDVETVLEGSVRKAGNRLRVTAQLIKIADGYHLWSERYDREMEDVFAIQDEISLAIVDKLKVTLLRGEKEKLTKRHTVDPEAYKLYLQGRYFWNKRYKGGMKKALEYFQQAIDKDPVYALPYVGIADSFNVLGCWGFIPPHEAYQKATAALKKALEIDDTLGEAHVSLGFISTFYDWDWVAAENNFKKALELNPSYALVHCYYSLYLSAIGRFDEAIKEARKAQELDPLELIINGFLGVVYIFAQRHDEALEQLRKTLEMDPNFFFTTIWLGWGYSEKKMYEEAISFLQKTLTIEEDMTWTLAFLGRAYALSGQKNEALKILDRLNELSREKYVSSFHKAVVYIGLEEKDQALKHIEKGLSERDSFLAFSKVANWMDNIRSDPRFKALLKKMKLDD